MNYGALIIYVHYASLDTMQLQVSIIVPKTFLLHYKDTVTLWAISITPYFWFWNISYGKYTYNIISFGEELSQLQLQYHKH